MRCPYCDKEMHTRKPPKRPKGVGITKRAFRPVLVEHYKDVATRDHIYPLSRGGKWPDWVWACGACNADKRELTLFQWRVVLSIKRGRLVVFPFEWSALRGLWRDVCCTLSAWRIA